ncbi:hypothetical protein C7I85_28885 [Mesorhizobium soli]|uniref:Uncharacterized protein n=1 Tax=Pseudaminobacter soli (ex Li et al. 2025) TaxID=1295366 RepID=A0A2P7RPU9_9HYPH|nr:hypothetical protein C7I85_28885 [Mesorhizobium soli]
MIVLLVDEDGWLQAALVATHGGAAAQATAVHRLCRMSAESHADCVDRRDDVRNGARNGRGKRTAVERCNAQQSRICECGKIAFHRLLQGKLSVEPNACDDRKGIDLDAMIVGIWPLSDDLVSRLAVDENIPLDRNTWRCRPPLEWRTTLSRVPTLSRTASLGGMYSKPAARGEAR